MLFIILVLVLSIPYVQTRLGKYATKTLNDEFKTHINIERVSLQFNGDVELKNIFIEDYKLDTLISVSELNTSIINLKNLINGELTFGDIDVENLVFNIKTYKGETDTNLDVFVSKFEDDNPKDSESTFLLSSSDVSIYNGIFRFIDENKETPKILEFENLNINATNFLINGSDVSTRINTLAFKDSRGLVMKNLMTNFSYTLTDMTFSNLEIETPNSDLKGDLKFLYNREDFADFINKVKLEAAFKNSNLLLDELNIFYDAFGRGQMANFDVNLSGTLNNLFVQDLRLKANTNTRIYGDILFENLISTDTGAFFMNGNFTNLSSTYLDLKALLPNILGSTIPSSFQNIGRFTITGNTQVSTTAVDADIEINTELGFIDSNLQITKINDIDNASYQGEVLFDKFDFGAYLENPEVGLASLNFNVKGRGFTAAKLNTQVKGNVSEIMFNNYNYKGLTVVGNIRNKIFDGNLVSTDENLKLNFLGLVDFSEHVKKYDFEAKIDYANLNVLNFIKSDSISIFRSDIKMNMNSSTIDDAVGKITFENTSYKNQNDTYNFNQLYLSSRFEDDIRFIEIQSPDIIEGELKGKFVFKDLKKLFQNSIGHIYTNYKPYKVQPNQSIHFNFKIYNKIIEVFYPDIELGKNTFIRGQVESDQNQFKLTFKSPLIKLNEYLVDNVELQVDNSNPVFNTYIEADSLKTKYYDVANFNLINVTVNDTLFVRTEFKGGKKSNDIYNLSLYHTINEENESVVGFKKSDVTIKDNKWFINDKKDKFNKVTFNKSFTKFNIDQFIINHNDEEIKLSGFIKDSTQKDLNLNFKNVHLEKITPDIDSLSLTGLVNGKLNILQKNGNYLPSSSMVIDDLSVNDFNLGSFNANITGNEDLTNYAIDLTIKDDIKKTFNALGNIYVSGKQSTINVDLILDDFSLQPLNPFLKDILSDIRGVASGKVAVLGNLNKPDIEGELDIQKGGMGIPYLNVNYDFINEAKVTLANQSFIFNKIQLKDVKYNTVGELDGSISHDNFSTWALDLNLRTPKLLVLDTKEDEDALYYGTGFIGGRASIKGPTDELVIKVVGETKAGTVFKIPLSDTESFGDNTYIHFITKQEKRARQLGKEVVLRDVKGLELDFDLDVTQDAEVEIIIDKESGHALKGRGSGGLLVEINTNGKFNMWGDFSVFEGVYNFAYAGLIQKEFTVKPGGTIAWEGNPLKAQINMFAVYKTQANPSPLLDNPINRSIPVELNINLTGDLERPIPLYDFKFPNVNSSIRSELQYRLESADDRQNQALYLISTGSFSRGLNELNFSGTIAERLNGILNGIFTNGDGKLNIGLNYEAGQNRPDYQTQDRFGVTLQTRISDRVLINGKVAVPIGGQSATQTVVAGDVEIDFLLNKDGTLTAKVFNRENSIRNFGEAVGYTQGIGLAYSVEFDTFKELIQRLFKKPEDETSVIEEVKPENNESSLPDYIKHKTPN
ncbi:hypothetical protein AW14_12885 [Siansivirga zeaxanthinifaciens CC-SAMT-1]|uniref:Translocation and assembly module TamB C-terminal domain-containing protein n=1 Tax=Siansivirga zeaxanthinifaciens CC-SAMT-1 TaxID=1454006 RepID=A0A0C5WBC8_9FLAO|nr:hypothetical protein AW14_12885 [Siansivirga zeaxanthinifaciens CC-SAMT-1]